MFLKKYRNYLLLHLIVFIWGFTAILGKQISLAAIHLVWYRIIIANVGIFIYLKFRKTSLKISLTDFFKFSGVGILIAFHWICFYQAIKVSNISVTLACFSSGALFTAFIEPLFFRRKISRMEVFFGFIVLLVIGMIFKIEIKYKLGIILSLLSALGSALFSVLNGLLARGRDSKIISFYELLAGFLGITVYFLFDGQLTGSMLIISTSDFLLLSILGIICTAFPFIVALDIMKEISPYTVNLTVNLESVYGIILAFLIFGEDEKMTTGFYIGTAVIFITVFANAVLKRRKK